MDGQILRCKRRKADGGIVDGCGWQGPPESGDMCPSCGGLILRVVSLGNEPADADAKPYAVRYGYCNSYQSDFATFAEALAFYRGYLARCAMSTTQRIWRDNPTLLNTDNIDGADDAKPWAQAGLTEAEWEQVENA